MRRLGNMTESQFGAVIISFLVFTAVMLFTAYAVTVLFGASYDVPIPELVICDRSDGLDALQRCVDNYLLGIK